MAVLLGMAVVDSCGWVDGWIRKGGRRIGGAEDRKSSEHVPDGHDRRVPDEEDESEHQDDRREEEALGHGVRLSLCFGEIAPPQRRRLGREAPADARALRTCKGEARGELFEVADTELAPQACEAVPCWKAGVAGDVHGAPDEREVAVAADRGGGLERAFE